MAQDAPAGPVAPADDFLRLACLRYEDDQPERWGQARQILKEYPKITQVSMYASAAAADVPRLAAVLAAAITHGMTERVRLFVAHGVDIVSPFGDGGTPAERAATTGHPELARYLVDHGAAEPDLRPGPEPAQPRRRSRLRDQRFNSAPLGWARYFGQEQLIELLEPLTTPEDETDG